MGRVAALSDSARAGEPIARGEWSVSDRFHRLPAALRTGTLRGLRMPMAPARAVAGCHGQSRCSERLCPWRVFSCRPVSSFARSPPHGHAPRTPHAHGTRHVVAHTGMLRPRIQTPHAHGTLSKTWYHAASVRGTGMATRPAAHRKTKRTINAPGHAHELTFSCHQRWPLLSKDRTRSWLVESIDRARRRHNFDLWAWVIMPEHVHLLIRPREHEYNIACMLKSIKQPVAVKTTTWLRRNNVEWLARLRIVRPSGKVEHRFWQQGGGYDRNVINPDYALAAIEYIHTNPVRRGLAESPAHWPWSSARWYERRPDALLEMDPLNI